MFKNYLTTAINNLLSDKLYSGINIIGLAFGLAASILIALYVVDETSYDKHWENADRIYRVNSSFWSTSGSFSLGQGTSMPVLPALQNFFPQEIETGTRFMSFESEITRGNLRFEELVTRVDHGFLEMFELESLAGSLTDVLIDPSKVALRVDVAQRIFGTNESLAEVIGLVLTSTYNGVSRDYEVAAIYRLPAGNTVLDLPMLTLLDPSVFPPFFNQWNANSGQSYVQLQPGVDVAAVTADLLRFSDQNVDMSSMEAGPEVKPSDRLRFELQNIAEIHLNSSFDDTRAGGNRTVVIAFTAIAVLVLLIGTINFTILSTAKTTKRAKEVALRKTIGARRLELIGQFLGESFCMVVPAMLVACVLVELLLPVFEAMVGKSLQINWLSPDTLFALSFVHIVVSLLGGLYPAFLLSHFRPATTLKATRLAESKGSLSLRNLLVVFQFGVSIALIIATSVIYLQVRYAMDRNPGFNRENILVIDNLNERAEVNARKETLKTQLLDLGAVTGATLSIHQPTQTIGLATVGGSYATPGESSATQSITTLGIDPDFFSMYQTEVVAGRGFSAALDQPAEIFPQQPGGLTPSKAVINVSASRLLGFASPEAAVNSQIRFKSPIASDTYDLTIIGVAADTNFYSMNAVPRPEVYHFSPGFTDVLSVRFNGNPQTVLAQVTEVWRSVMGDAEPSTSFVAQNMEAEFTQERVEAQLLVSFALLAIIIACLGLYGSASFSVERRTREIGIRKVMGAEVKQIITLLLWQFSKPVLLANAVAWPLAAWAMLTWLQRFPYQIDALVLLPLCVLAGFVALSIAWLTVGSISARVANRKPVLALRYE